MQKNARLIPLSLKRLSIILIMAAMVSSCVSNSKAPVRERTAPGKRPDTHVVAQGDTLFSIAWRYGLKYEDVARFNQISPPYLIRPKQIIYLNKAPSNTYKTQANPGHRGLGVDGRTPKTDARQKFKTGALRNDRTKPISTSAIRWRWPTSGVVLSGFNGNSGLNKGIDLSGKLGEPVFAAASGQVVYAGSGLRGYGKLLIIKHNESFLSAYAHNENLKVNEGDFVKEGQRIADMGSSGTDRVKLHFEIRRDGTPVDPLKYLPRR